MLGEAVAPADLEVGGVVRRRDLDRAGAERRIDGVVGHDRGSSRSTSGKPELACPTRSAVTLVLRMHGDGGVAQHRLGARGGDGDMAAPAGERISEVPELAVDLLLLGLLVRERGEAARAPVDDVVPAVDEPCVVQPDERLAHRAAQSPSSSVKYVRDQSAEQPMRPKLRENGGARLADVGPDPLHERLAAHVEARLTLRGEEPLDHVLRGDAGVIGARQPERPAAAHALEANRAHPERCC